MANDNRRRPPHGHDPEQARREATKAREARRKHLVLHPVIPVHVPLGLAGDISKKIQILPGTPSENVSCSWRDPDHTYSCDHFFPHVHAFLPGKLQKPLHCRRPRKRRPQKRQKKKLLL